MKPSDFTGGFLKSEDVPSPMAVVVERMSVQKVEGVDKLIMHFTGWSKGLVLNSTNINRMTFNEGGGEIDTSDLGHPWLKTQQTLYVDANVTYAGRVVGGLRIKQKADEYVQQGRHRDAGAGTQATASPSGGGGDGFRSRTPATLGHTAPLPGI